MRASFPRFAVAIAAAVLCVPVAAQGQDPAAKSPAPATQATVRVPGSELEAHLQANGPVELYSFYADRNYRPLWLNGDGSLNAAAYSLVELMKTGELDRIDAVGPNADRLAATIRAVETSGTSAASAEVEVLLSRSLIDYVTALLASADREMTYEHPVLQPFPLTAHSILQQAASAPSLHDYVSRMQWMHPLYASLRGALVAGNLGATERVHLLGNLDRVRGIPRPLAARHVIVDAGSARLWMYEGDRVVDSMKVIVGSAETPTPIMAGYIRTAVLNPYWNVPAEQVRRTIAPRARSMGPGYFRRGGYQVVSSWSPDAELLDPSTINWRSVESGELEVIVRQLPSAYSAMGKIKFELPNPEGIFLHDTPDKALMLKDERHLSNGCIRLEDAERFGRWLMGGSLPSITDAPEQRLDLEEPVPIYITYLTAHVDGDQLALGPDPYQLYGGPALGTAWAK